MPRAGDVRIPSLLAALVFTAMACGAAQEALPAATPVSSDFALPTVTFPSIDSSPATSTTLSTLTTSVSVGTEPVGSLAGEPPAAGEWQNVTEGIVDLPSDCGNLSKVVARPDQDQLIIGIALQGLWTSTDGVDTWSKIGQGPGSAKIINRMTTIIFDPESPARYWESGIYTGGGVYRTDNNGQTFRGLGDIAHVEALSIDLTDPNRRTLLATIHESTTTYLSTNGGETWEDISASLPADIGYATGPVVIDSQTFLLGTSNELGSGVLRSVDGGASWTQVFDSGVVRTPLRAVSDGAIYWIPERINGVIVSHDNGATWSLVTPKTEILPAGPAIVELPDGSLASLGVGYVIISKDQGASWIPVGPPVPFTPESVIYAPFRKAFYLWHAECDFSTQNAIQPDQIVRLDYDPTAP